MELKWEMGKPKKPGAYWVRGFALGGNGGKALVEVEKHDGELWSNLHQCNSERFEDKFSGWSALCEISDKFLWCGPLMPPNTRNQR